LKEFGLTDSPIVPIYPSEEDIYNKLVSILERKNEISEWGKKSREYVEKNHDYIKIAERYLQAWSSV
jgi:hypothetical protein